MRNWLCTGRPDSPHDVRMVPEGDRCSLCGNAQADADPNADPQAKRDPTSREQRS